ncbi:hypothetical protein Dimus_003996 [Dionaea muscipula]
MRRAKRVLEIYHELMKESFGARQLVAQNMGVYMVLFSSQIPTPPYPSRTNSIPYYPSIPNPNPYHPSTSNHPPNPVPCANEVHENDLVVEGDQGVEGDHQGVDQIDEDYVSDYGIQ